LTDFEERNKKEKFGGGEKWSKLKPIKIAEMALILI